MQPLTFRIDAAGLSDGRILKVVDAAEFARNGWAPERSLLLVDRCSVELQAALLKLPWGAIFRESGAIEPSRPSVRACDVSEPVSPGDVIELVPTRAMARVLYRRGDVGNVLFATERCNSYCLMCSQPPRAVDDDWRVRQNLDLISLIDPEEPSLAITGGEPTLLGPGLLEIINACSTALPSTDLQVLTNGRSLARPEWATALARVRHPKLQWNVPLYADVASIHDYVVQAKGAFDETIAGIHALGRAGLGIEIRVVLQKPTVGRLKALAHFIYRNLTFVRHIALMGIESIGFARANREALWIDPVDYQSELVEAARFLVDRGMRVSLYNLPLCVLPRELWPLAAKSISTWKNTYLPQCSNCSKKAQCGGFFASLTEEWTSRGVRPFAMEGVPGGIAS